MQICNSCYSPLEDGDSCENCSSLDTQFDSGGNKFKISPKILFSFSAVVAVLASAFLVLGLAQDAAPPTGTATKSPTSDDSRQTSQSEDPSDPESTDGHSHNHDVDLSPGREFSVIFDGESPETMPRWDPCKNYTYAMNKDSFELEGYLVRDGFETNDGDLLREAFERAEELSGLRFSYLSKTVDSYDQRKAYETNLGTADVLVQYLREDEYNIAASQTGLSTSIAFAGPLAEGIVGETGYLVAGRIVINVDEIEQLIDQGREEVVAAAYLHEIGHLIGLGHVDNPDALMFGGPSYLSSLSEGDVLGFEWAGSGPCER